jgi:sphingosine kinase
MFVMNTSLTGRPKRLFVFVNPFGGKKCGKKIYETEMRPLLEAANVNVTMQGSERTQM